MTTSSVTVVHEEIRAALVAAGVTAVYGPAPSLPVRDDGMVGQAAVLWPTPGRVQQTCSSGRMSGREDRVQVTCVGATVLDCLAAVSRVRAALVGVRLPSGGLLIEDPIAMQPTTEPSTDPVRVSVPLMFTCVTKGATVAVEP